MDSLNLSIMIIALTLYLIGFLAYKGFFGFIVDTILAFKVANKARKSFFSKVAKYGWILLILLIPVVNLIFFAYIYFND